LPAFRSRATLESPAGVGSGMVDQRLSCEAPVSAPLLSGIEARLSEPLAAVVDDACGPAALVAPLLTGVAAPVGATAPVAASMPAVASPPAVASVPVVETLPPVPSAGEDPTLLLTGGDVVTGGAAGVSALPGTRLPAEVPVVVVAVTAAGVGLTELTVEVPVMVDGAPVTVAGTAGPDPAAVVVRTRGASGVVVAPVTAAGVTQAADGVPVAGGALVPVAVPVVAGWAPEVAGGAADVLVVDGVLPLSLLEGVAVGSPEAVAVSRTGTVFPPSPAVGVSVVGPWPFGEQVAPVHSPCWAGPETQGAVATVGAARATTGSSQSPTIPASRQSDRPIR
jgi:hypothetical protein